MTTTPPFRLVLACFACSCLMCRVLRLSPFFLGPVSLYDGHVAKNVENAWQYAKVTKWFCPSLRTGVYRAHVASSGVQATRGPGDGRAYCRVLGVGAGRMGQPGPRAIPHGQRYCAHTTHNTHAWRKEEPFVLTSWVTLQAPSPSTRTGTGRSMAT